jgi:hypothetical protein
MLTASVGQELKRSSEDRLPLFRDVWMQPERLRLWLTAGWGWNHLRLSLTSLVVSWENQKPEVLGLQQRT